MEHYLEIFDQDAAFVELRADLETRLRRNRTEERLRHKASKRDLDWSDGNVRGMEAEWQMTSQDGLGRAADILTRHPHLVLDTTDLTAQQSAQRVLDWLGELGLGRCQRAPEL